MQPFSSWDLLLSSLGVERKNNICQAGQEPFCLASDTPMYFIHKPRYLRKKVPKLCSIPAS